MKPVLHTAKICNVDSVMFVDRIREMVSFELGKEIEKGVFTRIHFLSLKKCSSTVRSQRENLKPQPSQPY